MSILIKGMKMPSGCPYCQLSHWEHNEFMGCAAVIGKGRAVLTDKEYAESPAASRPDWCPLVPAPPHGRLIEDADAIETAWMILRGLGYLKEENSQLEQTVREVFATAPTIEVE